MKNVASARLIRQHGNQITVQFTLELSGRMLADEQTLQQSLNAAGQVAMQPMLKQFDTKGEPIHIAGVKHTVKHYTPQTYETPYGKVKVQRHTYQSSQGGRTQVPLEIDARMVLNSTPRFGQIVSGKYARFGADAICADLLECNGRKISHKYARKLSDFVGSVAQCYETKWQCDLPDFQKPVVSVSITLECTCLLIRGEGWRDAICGSISFYDKQGERLHTIFCAASPDYGKERFKEKFSREIELVQVAFPHVLYVGVADGAKDNWTFLDKYTKRGILDFCHAREYIGKAASAIFAKDIKGRDAWVDHWSSALKYDQGAPGRLLKELESQRAKLHGQKCTRRADELRQVMTYYSDNKSRMRYPYQLTHNLPIGSGVTEAACKALLVQRMSVPGPGWTDAGASCVLALRTLKLTTGRWQQFWDCVMRHGSTPL